MRIPRLSRHYNNIWLPHRIKNFLRIPTRVTMVRCHKNISPRQSRPEPNVLKQRPPPIRLNVTAKNNLKSTMRHYNLST